MTTAMIDSAAYPRAVALDATPTFARSTPTQSLIVQHSHSAPHSHAWHLFMLVPTTSHTPHSPTCHSLDFSISKVRANTCLGTVAA